MGFMGCLGCTSEYEIGLMACPGCGTRSPMYQNAEGDEMPKITVARPSNRHERADALPERVVHAAAQDAHDEHAVQQHEEREDVAEQEAEAEGDLAAPVAAEVRAWARDNGLDVSDRGSIPAVVLEQYEAARQEN